MTENHMLVFCKKCLVLCKLLSHLHNVQERCLCLIRSVPYLIETRFILPSKWQRLGDLLFHWLISDTWRRTSGVFPQSGLNFLTKGQRQLSCMHRYNSSSACTIPSQGALRSGIMSLLSSLPEVISYEGWSKERPVVLFFPEFCDGLFQLLNQMEVCSPSCRIFDFLGLPQMPDRWLYFQVSPLHLLKSMFKWTKMKLLREKKFVTKERIHRILLVIKDSMLPCLHSILYQNAVIYKYLHDI